MNYYYAKNEEKIGPLTLGELKKIDIKKDTLVWYEGLKDWTKAGEIKELKELFKVIPPPIPPPPPAPKKELKTPTPPPLPKKKVVIKEVKEPSTLPPSIVKKEKTLSPPTIKTDVQQNDNEISPPSIKKNKKPILIIILFIISLVLFPFGVYGLLEFKSFCIDGYGMGFYISLWITAILNFCAFTICFLMYRFGAFLYIISQSSNLILCFIVGFELPPSTLPFSIIFSLILFSYHKRMKKFRFKKNE